MNKCEWWCDGVCEYHSSYEEQLENDTFWTCDGTQEDQESCGMLK